jgi:hypothetical protein
VVKPHPLISTHIQHDDSVVQVQKQMDVGDKKPGKECSSTWRRSRQQRRAQSQDDRCITISRPSFVVSTSIRE